MKHDGETTGQPVRRVAGIGDAPADPIAPDAFAAGLLVGVLLGEGHFGGDGRQPQVTLRMHVRHESLFRWLVATFPGGRLYGPYDHGGRRYFQWMARGAFLRETLVPLLDRAFAPEIDATAHARYEEMKDRYRIRASTRAEPSRTDVPTPTPTPTPPLVPAVRPQRRRPYEARDRLTPRERARLGW